MTATSWLEPAAVAMAVATVLFNIRQVHWGWPLAVLASSMYCVLFWQSRLYGNAALHLLLASLALWGWWQWLRGTRPDGSGLRVCRLSRRGWLRTAVACALLWPATGLFLQNFTDSDVPWWDAFPTSVSLVAQFLLARKFLENWALWIVVDVVGIGLYGYKGLWLTAGLYALFIVLCVAGWRRWARQP